MKVLIKKVEVGTYDHFDDVIWDYWITAQLKSGKEIEIFDDSMFNLQEYEGKKVNLLLSSGTYSLLEDNLNQQYFKKYDTFTGIYHDNFQLSEKWKNGVWDEEKSYEFYRNYHHAIKIPDGFIILGNIQKKIERAGIRNLDKIDIKFIRFGLLAWCPII